MKWPKLLSTGLLLLVLFLLCGVMAGAITSLRDRSRRFPRAAGRA